MDDPRNRGFFGNSSRNGNIEDEPGGFFFRGGFGSPFDMFQPFREILQTFFNDDFVHPFDSGRPVQPESFHNPTPRDGMLKQDETFQFQEPHGHWFGNFSIIPEQQPVLPMPQRDGDLDDRISSEGLSAVLKEYPVQTERPPSRFQSFSKSFSSKTIRTADGRVEEESTLCDSNGKKKKTVKRILGDQSHTITTIQHSDGEQEVKEDYFNLDENSMDQFNQCWGRPGSNQNQLLVQPIQPPKDPDFMNIFRKFFGRQT